MFKFLNINDSFKQFFYLQRFYQTFLYSYSDFCAFTSFSLVHVPTKSLPVNFWKLISFGALLHKIVCAHVQIILRSQYLSAIMFSRSLQFPSVSVKTSVSLQNFCFVDIQNCVCSISDKLQ